MAFEIENNEKAVGYHNPKPRKAGTADGDVWEGEEVNQLDDALDALRVEARAARDRDTANAATAAAAAAAAHDRALGPTWDNVPTPWIIGHRGASAYVPENSLEGMEEAAAAGAVAECDLRPTSDGLVVLMHDETLDRTTDASGDVASTPAATVLAAAIDNIAGHPTTAKVPLFEEYVRRLKGRALMMPEMKVNAVIAGVTHAIEKYAAATSVLVASFTVNDLIAARAALPGLRVALLANDNPAVATLQTIGAWASQPPVTTVTSEYVAQCHAAGINVIPWTTNSAFDAERVLALGADGIISDDPAYIRSFRSAYTPSGKNIPVPPRLPISGWAGAASNAQAITVSGGYVIPSSGSLVHPPIRLPAGTWQVETALKLVTKNADLTRYIALRFCVKKDRDNQFFLTGTNTGYHFAYRSNGTVELVRDTNQTATVIATGTWTALSEGNVKRLRVTVTPTAITVTNIDNEAETITVSDATYTRDGFVDAFGSTNVVGLGATTVTY
jgi:glycerophosphoryl diester phosphodiesterase